MKTFLSLAVLAAGLALTASHGAQAQPSTGSPGIYFAANEDSGAGASSSRTRMSTNGRTGGIGMGMMRRSHGHHRRHRRHRR